MPVRFGCHDSMSLSDDEAERKVAGVGTGQKSQGHCMFLKKYPHELF